MWRTVRHFFIVLQFALADPLIGHALPRHRILSDGLRQFANTAENSVISNVKLKLNLSNASSTGKPTTLTLSTYSTFSTWDSRTTVLKTSITSPTSEDMLKAAYDKPVIYPPSSPSKMTNSTRRGGFGAVSNTVRTPVTTTSTKAPTGTKSCQKIVAGVLCEDDNVEYPTDAVKMLSKNDKFKSLYAPYFTSEVMTKMAPEINTRLDSANNEGIPICSVQENFKTYKPKKLMDKDENWRKILQDVGADNLTQVIQVEACTNPNEPCHVLSTMSSMYRSRCIQKYSYRKLVWLMDDNKTPSVDDFRVPSCCSCRYFLEEEFSAALRISNKHNHKSGG